MLTIRDMRNLLLGLFVILLMPLAALAQPYDFWRPMLHTEALQWPVPGHAVQFSSYARNGGNNDMGQYYGRDAYGWNILCDVQGAGLVTQMWFTYDHFADSNRIRIFIDDTVHALIDTSMRQLFGHITPFIPPLADSSVGSWYCHVPIPFGSRCRITYKGVYIYYHAEALALDAGRTVTAFTWPPSSTYLSRLDSLRARSTTPEKPAWITRSYQVVDTQTTISANSGPKAVISRRGCGGLRRLFVRLSDQTQATMENIWVRIFTDDSPGPDLAGPLSGLMGAAQGSRVYRSAYTGMMGDSIYLNVPISFARNVKVELWNRTSTSQQIRAIAEIATLTPADIGPYKLHGYFHIENPTRQWSPYHVCNLYGAGCFLGTLLDMQGPGTFVLEGDETMYRDGEAQPFWYGTGTDDYFLSGYYWAGAHTVYLGFQGCLRFYHMNIAAYRWHICDPVPFKSKFAMNFEVGWYNQVAGNYRSTIFYFAQRPKWDVADSSGDGKSFRGEVLYLTGYQLTPGTRINTVKWGNTLLNFSDTVRTVNADSVVKLTVRMPSMNVDGCQWLTAMVGSRRDTIGLHCWEHSYSPDMAFTPHRLDMDTLLARGDTLDVTMYGLIPGASAQVYAGGYNLPWTGSAPTAGTDGTLRGTAALSPPLYPGNYELTGVSGGSPEAVADGRLKIRPYYRLEVEDMDTAGWQGTALTKQYALEYAPTGVTDPWGRGVIRYLQGSGAGAFVKVRFNLAVADTYRINYFFARTGGGAKIRTTIDSTVDLNSYNSYYATPGLYTYVRSDTVRGTWHRLSAGPHTLRFEIVGRDTLANGWKALLDQIIIARDPAKFGTVPQRVTGLTAYRVPTGVRLLWRRVQADTAGHPLILSAYAVYRATSRDSLFHYLAEVPGTQTFFVDTNISRRDTGNVFYCVTARTGATLSPAVIRVWDQKDVAPVDMENERRR
jgi:hypothetical protein